MTLQIIMPAPRKVPDLYYYPPRLGQSPAVDIYICAGQLKMRGSGTGVAGGWWREGSSWHSVSTLAPHMSPPHMYTTSTSHK